MTDYAFPFIGSGDADYFEWAEVHVAFQREPTEAEQAAITARVPPPLRDSIDFAGRHLMVASDQFAHAAMMEAYEKAPHDETEDAFEGRFPFAASSKVEAFNEDTAAWLNHAHEQCPILVAFRAQDWEAGGTQLDDWHEWSVEQLPVVLDQFDPDTLHDRAEYLVRGLLEYEADTLDDIPEQLRDVALPGQREVEAIEAGDVDVLRTALGERTARWDDALPRIGEQVDGNDPQQLETLAGAADLLLDRELPYAMVVLLARAALELKVDQAEEIQEGVLRQCASNPLTASFLGQCAYDLMQAGHWEAALGIYDLLLELPTTDLTTYNNALYAVMDDNSGLGVQPERARRYIEAALPHGPENPSIFYNTACVYIELGETDRVFEYVRKALEHGYSDPQKIRDEALFESLRDDPEFIALFDA